MENPMNFKFFRIGMILLLSIGLINFSVVAKADNFEKEFKQSAEEFNIPVELLRAISFLNTRMVDRQGVSIADHNEADFKKRVDEKEIEGSPDYFGVMGLSDAQISKASALLNVSVNAIKESSSENIRATAALISDQAQALFSDVEGDIKLGDYYSVVAKFSGYDDNVLELLYADEVFSILRKGVKVWRQQGYVSGPVYLLDPVDYDRLQPKLPGWHMPQGYQSQLAIPSARDSRLDSAVADTYVQSSNLSSRKGAAIKKIVLHTCEGSGTGCVNYLKSNDRSASAHYVVLESGSVTQLVQEKDKAHHVRCCNSESIGIEHGGYAHKNTWTESQLKSSFELICDIAKRNNIPASRTYIQSHAELDPSRRTDPGPYYPWDRMLSEVKACVDGKPAEKPDLSIEKIWWTPGQPKVGDAVTFHASVRNATAASGAKPPNKCDGVQCNPGQTCNPSTGQCEGSVNKCTVTSDNPCYNHVSYVKEHINDYKTRMTGYDQSSDKSALIQQMLYCCNQTESEAQCPCGISNDCSMIKCDSKPPNKCDGVQCNPGQTCDPSTGKCSGGSGPKPTPGDKNITVLTWNLESFAMRQDGYNGVRTLFDKYAPYDLVGFQECDDLNAIIKNNKYLKGFSFGDAVAMAYNANRFDLIKQGTKIVSSDQYGNRRVGWLLLKDKNTNKKILHVNHHGCISCKEQPKQIAFDIMSVFNDNMNDGVIPLFTCDCQGSWGDDGYGIVEDEFRQSWRNLGKISATYSGQCGLIDHIYYNPSLLSKSNVESFGGFSCGCSGQGCGKFQSDHSSVKATFSIIGSGDSGEASVGISFMVNNQQVGWDASTPLSANTTTTFDMREPWQADQSGQFTIKAMVDDLNKVSESNESNNTVSGTIVIQGDQTTQKPDLVVTSLSWSPSALTAGKSVNLSAKVTNNGSAVAQSISTSFYIEQQMIGSVTTGSLGANQSFTFVLSEKWKPSAGSFKVTAIVDSLSQVAESNESNNNLSKTAQVNADAGTGETGSGGGSSCASESLTQNMYNGSKYLQNLRSFRDDELNQSETGQQITNLYYKHTDEIKVMLKTDGYLRLMGIRLLLRTVYAFNPKQVENNVIPLNGTYAKLTHQFLDRAQKKGSESLKQDFDELKGLINQLKGLTAKELLQEIKMKDGISN